MKITVNNKDKPQLFGVYDRTALENVKSLNLFVTECEISLTDLYIDIYVLISFQIY